MGLTASAFLWAVLYRAIACRYSMDSYEWWLLMLVIAIFLVLIFLYFININGGIVVA